MSGVYFNSAEQLLQLCQSSGLRVSELMMANEKAWRSEAEIRSGLMRLWLAMPDSRALPDDHAVLWRDVSAGALRGGIGLAREGGRVPAA